MAEFLGNWYHIFYSMIISSLLLKSETRADEFRQQYFRVEPKDIRAQEGSEVTLQCEIEYLKGKVQWTKDGFALGYLAEIPGFSRYKMVGDKENGVYNLRIRNVSLDDDAEYECQVGPHRPPNKERVEAIRSSANLTVLSPPASIEMVGFAPASKVEIRENQELTLECRVYKSKPAVRIVWYRGTSELKLDNREDRTIESNENNLKLRTTLYDVYSRIRLTPTADDDDANYTCEARHEALPSDMTLKTSVQLSVLYPPGDPFIEGYDPKRDIIRRGQQVELTCRSRGGNPLAQLVWYRNNEEVEALTSAYGRTSVNILQFKADTKDNNAKYTCKASSIVGPTHKETETNLTVNYAPLHVIILGSTEAKVGDIVQLNCTAGASNPPATIRWLVDGRQVHNNNSRVVPDPENGWITSSTISFPIKSEKINIVVFCHGVNSLLNENVVATHNINVLYPPSEPIIVGYESGKYVDSGTAQRLTCKSSGGNPQAELTWYKNDKKIHSTTKTEKTSVLSEIQILVNSTDNEAVYECKANSPALDIPFFKTVKFNVYFPPDNVVIKKEPTEFRAGTVGKLICDASSSNPEANLSFWRDGIEIEGINRRSKSGLHGGNVTTITTMLNITADMDGNVFTCQAYNSKLLRSVHADIRLSVLYKPVFAELNDTIFIGIEDGCLVIPLQANGHPASISYRWFKNGIPLVFGSNYIIEGSILNFTRLSRTDAGSYSCEAINSEGSSFLNFTVNVQYSATISSISNVVMVTENEDAELWCTIDAFPLSVEHVTWRRPGFLFETRTMTSFRNNTFYLTVRGVTRKDMGQFYCVADNGLGNETSLPAYLVVKHKPEIDHSPVLLKAAGKVNGTGRLICRASGAPKLMFAWSRDGYSISVNTTPKYHARYNQLDAVTYESILSIHKIEPNDFGTYQCKASNGLGFSMTNIHFSFPSKPDPPVSMSVINSTHDAVTISWIPGFDGGESAKYRIRYRDASSASTNFRYNEADINTVHTITGLHLGTSYVFSVLAYNKLGESDYVSKMIKATTSSEAPPSLPSLSEVSSIPTGMSLVVGAVVVLIIILFNILILVFCLLRRSRKQIVTGAPAEALLNSAEYPLLFIFSIAAIAVFLLLVNICILTAFIYKRKKFQGVTEQSSNKSGTIEMYAPSSYNETVTGETLSSVSEKSETYSDSRQDYDEKKRNGGNAYMIEQIDYPFQYPGYDTHPKEHNSIGHHRNPYINHNGTGYQSENSSRYSSTADPRYVTYPPPLQFAQPTLPPNGTLRRGPVPPPDVTVLTAPPPVSMSTFNYGGSENEGHLV